MAMATGSARQQRYRARRQQSGARRVDLWLDTAGQDLVAALQHPGESLDSLMVRALRALKGVTGDRLSPRNGPDAVTGDILLLTFVRLFFPEDKPVYPRRAYGLRTLPLAAINVFLASHGYMLHAAKVRNADWFVSCIDQAGQIEMFGLFELRRIDGEQIR